MQEEIEFPPNFAEEVVVRDRPKVWIPIAPSQASQVSPILPVTVEAPAQGSPGPAGKSIKDGIIKVPGAMSFRQKTIISGRRPTEEQLRRGTKTIS